MQEITIDEDIRLPVFSEICTKCIHITAKGVRERKCLAFPDGIPDDIWIGDNDHRHPYPGDHDIQFTQGSGIPLDTLAKAG